jgi:hypothetical protein
MTLSTSCLFYIFNKKKKGALNQRSFQNLLTIKTKNQYNFPKLIFPTLRVE